MTRIYQCDMCGARSGNHRYIVTLRDQFQTSEVKDVCNGCLESVDEMIVDAFARARRDAIAKVKEWMEERKRELAA